MLRVSESISRQGTSPDLTYNISGGLLYGRIDGAQVNGYAGSGGRAGTKDESGLNWWLANNPLATRVKLPDDKSHPGGPLPMGRYYVIPHERRDNWLRLQPVSEARMYGRSGMAIHGRGQRGSDGCIVPTDFTFLRQLCALVKQREDAGGPHVVLQVVAIGQDLDRQNRTA